MEAGVVTTMVITFEQNGPQMAIRFKSEEGPTSTLAESAAVEETTNAIAEYLAKKAGDATIVRRDPPRGR